MKLSRLLLLLSVVALVAAAPSARAAAFGWKTWNAGMAEAKSTGRPVLVDVYTEWCGWCKRMDRDVYSRADVRDFLSRKFVAIKLDAESGALARFEERNVPLSTIAQRFRVSGYPTTIFLRSDGAHLVNVPGYVPAERFLLMLEYIGDDHIGRGVKWSDFERSGGPPPGR